MVGVVLTEKDCGKSSTFGLDRSDVDFSKKISLGRSVVPTRCVESVTLSFFGTKSCVNLRFSSLFILDRSYQIAKSQLLTLIC
jgi:hypothetical protein